MGWKHDDVLPSFMIGKAKIEALLVRLLYLRFFSLLIYGLYRYWGKYGKLEFIQMTQILIINFRCV